jgi:hypothetical protein
MHYYIFINYILWNSRQENVRNKYVSDSKNQIYVGVKIKIILNSGSLGIIQLKIFNLPVSRLKTQVCEKF